MKKNYYYLIIFASIIGLAFSCAKNDLKEDIDDYDTNDIEIEGKIYPRDSIQREIGIALKIPVEKLIFNKGSNSFSHVDFNFTYYPAEILNLKK